MSRSFKPPLLAFALLVFLAPATHAELCTIDNVPAATLLLPYFEVDLVNQDCVNTLFSVNNARADATLAHVTLWTDWSQPTVDFDIFLTGYDVVTINLRDVFRGNIPITADAQSDPTDTISPHGSHPAWDGSFPAPPNCINFFPFFENPVITGFRLDLLVKGHTGQPVQFHNGLCIGADHADNHGHARGYLTIDDARRCGLEDPTMDVYFGGADPVATNDNQLWGDFFLLDPQENFAMGEPLVHIEADAALSSATGYTFYGRYTSPSGDDQREPLGTSWAVRYLDGGAFTGGTDLLVWRDSTTNNQGGAMGGFACGVGPNWLPLNETEVVAFDEQENATELCFSGPGGVISPPDPGSDPTCFPLETQRVSVGEGDLDPPYNFGWLALNLNINDVGVTGDVDFGTRGDVAQSYVIAHHSASGRFAVGLSAVALSSACDDVSPLLATGLP